MATLVPTKVLRTGVLLGAVAAAGGGDKFANDGRQVAYFKNGSGAPITVTVVTQKTVDGLAVTDRAVVVAAGEERMIGPFDKETYNDTDGNVNFTYSGVTSLTVAVLTVAAEST